MAWQGFHAFTQLHLWAEGPQRINRVGGVMMAYGGCEGQGVSSKKVKSEERLLACRYMFYEGRRKNMLRPSCLPLESPSNSRGVSSPWADPRLLIRFHLILFFLQQADFFCLTHVSQSRSHSAYLVAHVYGSGKPLQRLLPWHHRLPGSLARGLNERIVSRQLCMRGQGEE